MNEVQINKIKKRADEYATSCFPYEKQFLEREAVVKCCVHVVIETIAELEKENAKLKDEWQEQVQKANEEGYARTLQTIQLSKAKDLLEKWVELYKPKSKTALPTPIQVETEQFLNK